MSALISQYQNSKPSVTNMSKKISIIGGRGFTGQELIKLIDSHPQFELAQAFSSSVAGKEIMIDERKLKKTYASLDEDTEFVEEDAIILALPNNEAAKWADKISKQNSQAIILDLSADHRFDGEWHYSVPELTQTIDGNKISNPGCYATAMQLMLAPINNMIDGEVNFFGISGYSCIQKSQKNSPLHQSCYLWVQALIALLLHSNLDCLSYFHQWSGLTQEHCSAIHHQNDDQHSNQE